MNDELKDSLLWCTQAVNRTAMTLTNWLFVLSLVGFAMAVILHAQECAIWFAVSLTLCVVSTAFEYWRLGLLLRRLSRDNIDVAKAQDNGWYWLITITRIVGYGFVFVAFLLLLYKI